MANIRFMVGLILLLSLLGVITPTSPAVASPDEVKWSRTNIPTEGKPGDWVLASGSDVQHLTMAIDDSLYCYAKVSGDNVLFKSSDDGHSWVKTDYDGGAIADIVGSSIDADIIYVTDGSHVYQSDDAGDSFDTVADTTLPPLDTNESITCLNAGYMDDDLYLFIGTADADDGDFGGVYYIAEADFGAKWTDLEVGNYDVYSIAGSPEFASDFQIIAVATDEVHTRVVNNYGIVGNWPEVAELTDLNGNSFDIVGASDICFPADYDDEFFVGVSGDAVNGGVYRVNPNTAYRLDDVNADISSLDLTGNARLMAGAQDSNEVYYSTDDGDSWDTSDKAPSGDGPTYVVMADDFAESGRAYAATSGTDSAFSYTANSGVTWNQVSLIDANLNSIVDLALSPNYSQDDTLFMLTWGAEYSLWRSLSGGTRWERVFTSSLPNIDSLNLVKLSPQYGNRDEVVFLAGVSNGNPAIWKSTDNGQSFKRRSAPSAIDTWAVVNDTTLFISSYDSTNHLGLIYGTTNSGLNYSTPAVVGSQILSSIALSPDYDEDETMVVGNKDGWVYWSEDNGDSFEPLPVDATLPPLNGAITVAFDPKFSSNSTIYAASDTADTGIHRFIIGASTDWEGIDSPAGGMFKQLVVLADGTLYATNFKADGGIERCLNPTYSLGPTFETVTRGLDDSATLTKLWQYGNQLWSIDTTNNRLMTLTDSLTQPPTLTSPLNKASGVGVITSDTIRDIRLDWKALSGATSYEWQLDYDTDFSTVSFEDDAEASSARLPALEPATTYYWRVRVTEPVLSPWSAKWSFTTTLGAEAIVPKLTIPEAGVTGMSLKPIFQWSPIAGAHCYELLVSTDISFANPVIIKIGDYALPSTAWQCDISLDYDTTYYWKVRATSSDTCSDWSAASAFTTESQPEPDPDPEPSSPLPSSPSSPLPTQQTIPEAQQTTPDWIIYLMGFMGFTVTVLLVIILVLVMRIRQP